MDGSDGVNNTARLKFWVHECIGLGRFISVCCLNDKVEMGDGHERRKGVYSFGRVRNQASQIQQRGKCNCGAGYIYRLAHLNTPNTSFLGHFTSISARVATLRHLQKALCFESHGDRIGAPSAQTEYGTGHK